MVTLEKANDNWLKGFRLGKAPAKGNPKQLLLKNYLKKLDAPLPASTNYWTRKAPFPLRTYGNDMYGDCTKASQAYLAQYMQRIEHRRTITITDEEVIRVYLNLTKALYGGGDTGAYEEDALNQWRRPDETFRDTTGRPHTIDAHTRINHLDITEVKRALLLAGAHGIKVCYNLPWAWSNNVTRWDIPPGQQLTGDYMPGSWGGHSMTAKDYTREGLIHPSTWGGPDILVTWAGLATYCDESHLAIDSVDSWRKTKSKLINIPALISDVNNVSSLKIK